jgi:hypothetical protein
MHAWPHTHTYLEHRQKHKRPLRGPSTTISRSQHLRREQRGEGVAGGGVDGGIVWVEERVVGIVEMDVDGLADHLINGFKSVGVCDCGGGWSGLCLTCFGIPAACWAPRRPG